MEFNKIAGASIGALLLFLLLNFFSAMVYGTEEVEHAPADGDGLVLAYAVPVEASATQEEPAAIDLFALMKNADPAKGEKVARACVACHSFKPGEVKIGPPLDDVVGRKIASETEFSYSDAMKAEADKDSTWTPEHLFHFVDDPQKVVPGTLMTFAGVKKPEDRANLIAYLNTLGGSPIDLTEGLEPLAPAEGEAASGAEGDGTEVAAAGEEAAGGETATDASEPAATESEAGTTAPAAGDGAEESADESTEGAAAPASEADAPAEAEDASDAAESATTEDAAAAAPAEEDGNETATETAAATTTAALGGDAANGEKVFRRCAICHSLEPGQNKIGPSLHGVIGRDIGTEEGFSYSDAMLAAEGTWTPEHLSAFLEDPQAAVPGNKMPFPGLPKEQDRIDLLTYLQQASQ